MIRLWNHWVDCCARTELGTTLAAYRIVIGSLLLLEMWTFIDSGIGYTLYVPVSDGGFASNYGAHPVVKALGGPSLELTRGLLWTGLVSSALLVLGVGGRVTALVLLQVLIWFQSLSPDISGGYDRLFTNGLWLLVVGNGSATWSLSTRFRTGRWVSEQRVLAFPRHLMAFQLVVMYVATGINKTSSFWDPPFHAIYYALHRMTYIRWELPWVSDILPLLQFGTAVTLWWEITFFVLGIWYMARQGWLGRRQTDLSQRFDLRWVYLGIGLIMHSLVSLTLNVGPFTGITFAYYLAFFAPEEVSGFARRVVKNLPFFSGSQSPRAASR